MKKIAYFAITILAISAYFTVMHYATNIIIEELQDSYRIGDEIRFTAKVTGFGDGANAYSVEFQNEIENGRGLAGLGSSNDNVSYLNFPLPFEETIHYARQTNYYEDAPGSYFMRFSTLGHTVEKRVTLLP
ncbi:MAG: hypothetical protein ACRD9Q_11645 [Nitrososphaeraceae archaeon]